MTGALAGLRVVDCSRLIAGGVLATILADHGADVLKIENPRGGDPLRTWLRDRGELWWKVYARGKRSISPARPSTTSPTSARIRTCWRVAFSWTSPIPSSAPFA
ncbi:MAG: hypothetical protein DME07_10050 [Candidatus Rokuibacteriota bacterium]|nr:MAG: hypothetical protein DME07_10050 [Candidatus Rokubacteria bacterium]